MSQAVYAETDDYTVRWDDDLGAIVHEWHRFVSGEDFREGSWTALDAIKERGATKLLVDQREMNVVDDEDMVWLVENWTPEITDAGIEYAVNVITESVIAEMNMEKVVEHTADVEGEHDVTTDVEEARELIRQY